MSAEEKRVAIEDEHFWQITKGDKSAFRTPYDTVIAGDVLYKPELCLPLLATAHALLRPGGVLLLMHHPRAQCSHDLVRAAVAKFGLGANPEEEAVYPVAK